MGRSLGYTRIAYISTKNPMMTRLGAMNFFMVIECNVTLSQAEASAELCQYCDYLILYTRFIFLVTVKAGCENVFFVPDPLGDHWYVSEHDYE